MGEGLDITPLILISEELKKTLEESKLQDLVLKSISS
jgi:hypothetical protein